MARARITKRHDASRNGLGSVNVSRRLTAAAGGGKRRSPFLISGVVAGGRLGDIADREHGHRPSRGGGIKSRRLFSLYHPTDHVRVGSAPEKEAMMSEQTDRWAGFYSRAGPSRLSVGEC